MSRYSISSFSQLILIEPKNFTQIVSVGNLRITDRDTPLSKATMLMAALLPASQLTEVF
ncbi:hypothetical protein QT327_21450 [Olivibacter sp. 47]|uniref:hypothetical protein n=1 Tax=Olivibacter sp. 47 TaxID=3056486 RepID=UPI0025A3D11A|nr:hypothetical protein [Olivibacter sp. 47]MDM8176883.1 hypothetical protein [Olivibacter sp. 47]